MESASLAVADPTLQRWAWWPLLPLYPYGRRPTLVRELVPDRIWSFEQLHGIWYVAVPIRMTVVRVDDGLLLYAPVPPTQEVLNGLRALEQRIGPVRAIVLPTASGLEHKLPVPAMARAFPEATVWVTEAQWSFPLQLPGAWLGFPRQRTRVLGRDGFPYPDQLRWIPLGPLDLGLGTFLELACFDQATGSLLVTDALVVITPDPPAVFNLDPTPLLFHARERGNQQLEDSLLNRHKGWLRLIIFSNFLRPANLEIPPIKDVIANSFAPGCRDSRSHYGIFPFRWLDGWQEQANNLISASLDEPSLLIAPVLERLVFPRSRAAVLAWLDCLLILEQIGLLIPAHYDAPVLLSLAHLEAFKCSLIEREWAPDAGPWHFLSRIDTSLKALRLVP